jgi:hypothetical protein
VTIAIDTFFDDVNGIKYNSTRWMGTTLSSSKTVSQTAHQVVVNGAFDPAPSPSVYPPNVVDFRTIDTLRVHSNVAKRFFEIKGGRLSSNDVLFELTAPNTTVGTTLVWENNAPELYEQEIFSNFDNMVIELRDRTGNLIDFQSYCSFTMLFCIEREIEVADPKDRLKNLQNLNQLSSV